MAEVTLPLYLFGFRGLSSLSPYLYAKMRAAV